MPTIHFTKNRPALVVNDGANLMQALLAANIPVASSCDGEGVCAKCKISVQNGMNHLSPENEVERFLKEKNKIPPNMRISCQTFVHGDITIDASYW